MLLRSSRQLGLARAKTKYTTYDIAKWLHMSQSTVTTWESGRQLPAIDTVMKLVKYAKDHLFDEHKEFWEMLTDKKFILAAHYEKFLSETFKDIQNVLHLAIMEGMRTINDTAQGENIPSQRMIDKYIALFTGNITYKDFVHYDYFLVDFAVIDNENITGLPLGQKIDFIMFLFKEITFIFNWKNCLPYVKFTSWNGHSLVIKQGYDYKDLEIVKHSYSSRPGLPE